MLDLEEEWEPPTKEPYDDKVRLNHDLIGYLQSHDIK